MSPDEAGFFAEVGFEKRARWMILVHSILLVISSFRCGRVPGKFRGADGVFAQPFDTLGISRFEELLQLPISLVSLLPEPIAIFVSRKFNGLS